MKTIISQRFIKFLIVGASGTAIDFILFFIFYQMMGIGLIVSNVLSYGTGLTSSFFINRAWTFSDGNAMSHKRIWLALGFGYIGLIINTILIWAMSQIIPVFISKALAVFVIVVYNYFTNKHIVFLAK